MHSASKVVVWAMTILCLGSGAQGQVHSRLVITHTAVITGDSSPALLDQTVLIEDGTIQRVAPAASSMRFPVGATIIDGRGKSLLPGLADMHVHLVGGWDGTSADLLN